MSRLNNYVTEAGILGISEEDMDNAADLIKKNCKKLLNEVQGYDFPYRGFVSMESAKRVLPNSSILYEHKVRKDRKPRYITPKTHEFLSKLSKSHFGWDTRKEGLFTGSKNTAKSYGFGGGSMRAVLPIGRYEYVAMGKGLQDLYRMYDRPNMYPQDFGNDNDYEEYFEQLKTIILKGYKRNKGLVNLVQNQGMAWEVIFKCDKYYSLPMVRVSEMIERLY